MLPPSNSVANQPRNVIIFYDSRPVEILPANARLSFRSDRQKWRLQVSCANGARSFKSLPGSVVFMRMDSIEFLAQINIVLWQMKRNWLGYLYSLAASHSRLFRHPRTPHSATTTDTLCHRFIDFRDFHFMASIKAWNDGKLKLSRIIFFLEIYLALDIRASCANLMM